MRKSLISKVLSSVYGLVEGSNANYLKDTLEDTDGALRALDTFVTNGQVPIESWDKVYGRQEDSDTKELAALFNHYGSDKATRHNYYVAYASLLKGKRTEAFNLLEIGLGTNNTSFRSNMGKYGKPGASLRAFRDWAPNAQVYGAEIDIGVLFEEERIKTYFVDQTQPKTLDVLTAKLPKEGLDLIIDDGLHTPWANFNVVNFALPLLKKDGVLVIEDIVPKYLPLWHIAVALYSNSYECRFVQMKTEMILVLKRKSN